MTDLQTLATLGTFACVCIHKHTHTLHRRLGGLENQSGCDDPVRRTILTEPCRNPHALTRHRKGIYIFFCKTCRTFGTLLELYNSSYIVSVTFNSTSCLFNLFSAMSEFSFSAAILSLYFFLNLLSSNSSWFIHISLFSSWNKEQTICISAKRDIYIYWNHTAEIKNSRNSSSTINYSKYILLHFFGFITKFLLT